LQFGKDKINMQKSIITIIICVTIAFLVSVVLTDVFAAIAFKAGLVHVMK
jgi:hypothetical protein